MLFSYSPPAIERLSSGLFQEVIITNTVPVLEKNYFPQLTVLSVANLLGETIWRVHDDCSVSSIFQWRNICLLANGEFDERFPLNKHSLPVYLLLLVSAISSSPALNSTRRHWAFVELEAIMPAENDLFVNLRVDFSEKRTR